MLTLPEGIGFAWAGCPMFIGQMPVREPDCILAKVSEVGLDGDKFSDD